jgi:hypothetical protein
LNYVDGKVSQNVLAGPVAAGGRIYVVPGPEPELLFEPAARRVLLTPAVRAWLIAALIRVGPTAPLADELQRLVAAPPA